ncbi:hypothetical protein M569_09183 [Genlisea aurea]|uniref:Uncharacterized protein n=1 Tax=Genlisea aurea TaxID=192259 RepID=S8CF93_9LAMI|nr:hypothetical protein M569_09183 [Genlisea aurea]
MDKLENNQSPEPIARPKTELEDEDKTRESLIGISYSVPSSTDPPPPPPNDDDDDGNELYRAKLISISHLPSPDDAIHG